MAGDGDSLDSGKPRCGTCSRRISLVESLMPCRCDLVFCERHRPPESHNCQFDWQNMQRQKVARENPMVIRAQSSVTSLQTWCDEYEKHHPVATKKERHAQLLHSAGFFCFVMLGIRGMLLLLTERRLVLLPQQIVLGYLFGLALSHALPGCLGCATASSCRFCVFSWDFMSPSCLWCAAAEWERVKEHLMFALTKGKQNCLTRQLYDGPRTVPHIFSTVTMRLGELAMSKSTVNCQ
mmetsp:Transcript_46361/g.91939  ORF Transcript_46361/g.91939 Transcript_46361/m.91939 type:complete len:237 (-) Transcript_46361:13-723(-)